MRALVLVVMVLALAPACSRAEASPSGDALLIARSIASVSTAAVPVRIGHKIVTCPAAAVGTDAGPNDAGVDSGPSLGDGVPDVISVPVRSAAGPSDGGVEATHYELYNEATATSGAVLISSAMVTGAETGAVKLCDAAGCARSLALAGGLHWACESVDQTARTIKVIGYRYE